MKKIVFWILLAHQIVAVAQSFPPPQLAGLVVTAVSPALPFGIQNYGYSCQSSSPSCGEYIGETDSLPVGASDLIINISTPSQIEGSIKITFSATIFTSDDEIIRPKFVSSISLTNNVTGEKFFAGDGVTTIETFVSPASKWSYTADIGFFNQPGTYIHPGFALCDPHLFVETVHSCQLFDSFVADTSVRALLVVTVNAVSEPEGLSLSLIGLMVVGGAVKRYRRRLFCGLSTDDNTIST